jgi:CHAT domain-containing protein/tetratricopeptide (TPR) repeat protein
MNRTNLWPTLLLAGLWLAPLAPAWAQAEGDDAAESTFDDADLGGTKLTPTDATRLLAQPLPDEPGARYALLQRQFYAAKLLEERGRFIELARQLVDAGRGRPGGDAWILPYLNAEFTWGSSGKALQACDAFVTDASLPLATRASVALRQAYFASQGRDRALTARLWSRADGLANEAMKQVAAAPKRIAIERLQVRSEVERLGGNPSARVTTMREAVGLARRHFNDLKSRASDPRNPDVLDAYGWLDGSLGMLTFALVAQGRQQEAINVAQANIALWRAGAVSDGLGARWNYRLALGLVETQQYDAGLAAARLSDEMLERSGATTASHTRWHARREIVFALMGLKRWKEADESYRQFLSAMPPDTLARTRASDPRLLVLLAAKAGRLDEALEGAERSHRSRLRLYGARHPLTQEAAGVRGVVRLLRGDTSRAMSDFEDMFAATLDTSGGWLDLGQRGVRGFVFGIAFDEFMRFIAERALTGEPVDAALTDRALQIADRNNLSVTQQAITDSTARVLAATPALRSLLEQEQTQRQAAGALFTQLNATLGQEDRVRRETQTDAFKALPEAERQPRLEALRLVREQVKAQQAETSAARAALNAQREVIAKQFPAYADLVTPATPRPAQLRTLLGAGEALLVVAPGDAATLVWLVRADGRSSFHASRLTASEIATRVGALRALLDPGSATAGPSATGAGPQGSTQPPTQAPTAQPSQLPAQMHALYRELLGPQEALLADVRSLIVAASGPLASLPFAALVTRAPEANAPSAWLVRRIAVTQLPSPSALLALRRVAQVQPAAKALLGFGDPLFDLAGAAPSAARPAAAGATATVSRNATSYDAELGLRYRDVPPLPETRTELLAVAAALGANPNTDLVMGAQATRRAVLEANLLDRRVVAFATHGLMPGELPGVSKPALAMAANADERESPLLELDDVLGLRLNAQWVLLSACNTAAGEQGGAAMSGLVRGFFFAGARSVLATHWAVDSESAAALSTAVFKAQASAGVSRAESLRQAQLALIDGTLGAGRWAHPYHWAPYALFGDPVR